MNSIEISSENSEDPIRRAYIFLKSHSRSPEAFSKDGGYQVQFNVVGKETLCNAQKNPIEYSGLVVRVAGYSVYFSELSKSAQDEIIARTEY